jgi:hypothetical protein
VARAGAGVSTKLAVFTLVNPANNSEPRYNTVPYTSITDTIKSATVACLRRRLRA